MNYGAAEPAKNGPSKASRGRSNRAQAVGFRKLAFVRKRAALPFDRLKANGSFYRFGLDKNHRISARTGFLEANLDQSIGLKELVIHA